MHLHHALCESCAHDLGGLRYTPGVPVNCPECGHAHMFELVRPRRPTGWRWFLIRVVP